MSKQQFKAQADICKKALDTLHKAIELDPVNVEEYEAGIAYTECVMKASNAIVKACEIVEPKKQKEEPKAEEAEIKSKKAKTTAKKSKPKEEPKSVIEVEPAPVEEKEAEDLFAMFGD